MLSELLGLFHKPILFGKIYFKYLGIKMYTVILLTVVLGLVESIGFVSIIPLLNEFISNNGNIDSDPYLFDFIHREWGIELADGNFLLIFIFFVFFTKGALSFLIHLNLARYKGDMSTILKVSISKFLAKKTYLELLGGSSGDHLNNFIKQSDNFILAFHTYMNFLMHSVLAFIYVSLAVFSAFNLGVVSFIFGALFFILFRVLNRKMSFYSSEAVVQSSIVTEAFMNLVAALPYLKVTKQVGRYQQRVFRNIRSLVEVEIKASILISKINFLLC